jgi:hypothetical protein
MNALRLAAIVLLVSCGGDAEPPPPAGAPADAAPQQASPGTQDCLVGAWTMEEAGVTRSFTFNANHTGEEVQSPEEIRPFSWSLEDDETVRIIYTAHGDVQSSEWDLELDCTAGRLSFYGAHYTKQQ